MDIKLEPEEKLDSQAALEKERLKKDNHNKSKNIESYFIFSTLYNCTKVSHNFVAQVFTDSTGIEYKAQHFNKYNFSREKKKIQY